VHAYRAAYLGHRDVQATDLAVEFSGATFNHICSEVQQHMFNSARGDVLVLDLRLDGGRYACARQQVADILFRAGCEAAVIWASRDILRRESQRSRLVNWVIPARAYGFPPDFGLSDIARIRAEKGRGLAIAARGASAPPKTRRWKIPVVLPAFNEVETINTVIDKILSKCLEGAEIELLIVESNSNDDTRERVLAYEGNPNITVILEDRPRGKGHAVRIGLRHATGDSTGQENAKLTSLVRLQLISQFVAHGAPVSALADVAKVAFMSLRFGLTAASALRVVVYERVTRAVAAVVLGVAALLVQWVSGVTAHVLRIEMLVWSAGIIGIIASLFAMSKLNVAVGVTLVDKAIRGMLALSSLLLEPRFSILLLISATAQLGFMALAFVVLANSMHLVIAGPQILLFMPFISLVSSLPIFYVGWGAREAATVLTFCSMSSISPSEAVALSLAFGVCFFTSLPGAFFWLLRPSMRKAVTDTGLQLQTSALAQ
jgi:hypothetical protein